MSTSVAEDRRIRAARRRAYTQYLTLEFLHICLFFTPLEAFLGQHRFVALNGLISLFIYGRLFIQDVKASAGRFNPLWFYIGMSAIRMGLAELYVASVIAFDEERWLWVGMFDPFPHIVEAHLLLSIGNFFFIGAGFLTMGKWLRGSTPGKNQETLNAFRLGLTWTIVAIAIRFIHSRIQLGGLGQIIGIISNFGIPGGVFLMFDSCRARGLKLTHKHTLWAIGIQVIAVIQGFDSYMKSDLLIAIMPLLILELSSGGQALGRLRRIRLRTALIASVIGYFFLFTVSGYSQLRRRGYWENMDYGETRPGEEHAPEVLPDLIRAAKASIPGSPEYKEMHVFPTGGVWNMAERLAVTPSAATSLGLVELRGHRDGNFFVSLVVTLTPRILWPNKPQIVWGREVAVEIGQAASIESATSAYALTMPGAFYWWGGYPMVVFVCALSGFGYIGVFRVFETRSRLNPVAASAVVGLAWNGVHWKESDFLGGIPFYLYLLIVLVPLSKWFVIQTPRKRLPHRGLKNAPTETLTTAEGSES